MKCDKLYSTQIAVQDSMTQEGWCAIKAAVTTTGQMNLWEKEAIIVIIMESSEGRTDIPMNWSPSQVSSPFKRWGERKKCQQAQGNANLIHLWWSQGISLCKITLQNLKSAWRSNLITRGSSSRAHTKFKFIQDAETRTSCPCFCLAFVLFQEPGVPHHELRMQKLKKAIHVLSWFLLILTTEPPKKAHLFNIFPMPKKENEKPVLNLLFQTFIPCHQFCWDHPVVLLSRACNFIITSTFSEVIKSYPSYPPTVSSSFTFSSFSSIRTTTSNLDLSSESCLHCLQPNTCISFLYCKQNNLLVKKRISLCYCFWFPFTLRS